MRLAVCLAGLVLSVSAARALQPDDVYGTWQLVSSTRKVLATGQVDDTYGPHPAGWIMYGRDGRMMVLIVNCRRPRPTSIDKMTDADRAGLFKTMLAYSGTFAIKGNTITHNIDTSWNQIWSGTKTVRDVELNGDSLIYTTKPAPASMDGKVSVVTLVWKRARAAPSPGGCGS